MIGLDLRVLKFILVLDLNSFSSVFLLDWDLLPPPLFLFENEIPLELLNKYKIILFT